MKILETLRLDGRRALVTGAARGLGWEIARALAEAGAHVLLNGRDAARLAPRVAELRDAGLAAEALAFDVADAAAVERAVASAGRVDILVNNVGARDRRSIRRMDADDFAALVDVDLTAAYRLTRALLPGMAERRSGRVVMVTTVVAELAATGDPAYIAAKGGLAALTRAVAAEYGRHGVTCNAIAPGFFATETNRDWSRTEVGARWAARVPLGRWGEPAEIAGAALLLVSPAGAFINGHTLVVDGGVAATLGVA